MEELRLGLPAGRSNMAGRGIPEPEDLLPIPGVYAFDGGEGQGGKNSTSTPPASIFSGTVTLKSTADSPALKDKTLHSEYKVSHPL